MERIEVEKINEVWMNVRCDASMAYELSDYFSFFTPGYKFNPKYKAGFWDGKIRLFHLGARRLYVGLLQELQKFCDSRGYELVYGQEFSEEDVPYKSILKFLEELNLPADMKPRDYQIKALVKAVRSKRRTTVSPTSSGKSLIMYLICRWYGLKTLIIVPTTSLVRQLASDFQEYGYEEEIHQIVGGVDKYSDENITISTWQSLANITDPDYYDSYSLVLSDECHMAKAQELTKILEKCTNVKYRFGFTGTLDNTKVNPIIIQGLLGPVYQTITTKELMERGDVADLKIKALVLRYPEEVIKQNKKLKYQEEIDFLCASEIRNKFIKNLVASLDGNTLVLFNYVDKHGKILYNLFQESIKDKPIYWISGSTDVDEREEIRKIVDKEKNCVLVASKRTTGTGISIKQINNIVFVSPGKSLIETLQNIGRALRKSLTKSKATLYDIADDLSYKSHTNYTLEHFKERIKIYDKEKFAYKIYQIGLK